MEGQHCSCHKVLFILEKENGGRSTVSPCENPCVLLAKNEREGGKEREGERDGEGEREGRGMSCCCPSTSPLPPKRSEI
jgi:hypothetical protein